MQVTQLKPLTNRSASAGTAGRATLFDLPADGFYQLAPFGRAANEREDGTPIIQVIDKAAAEAMRNRMIAEGGEMLIDFDHESRDLAKRTTAAAWLNRTAENIEVRADGLYGRLRLSGSGEQALVNGDYRLGSPEFADDDTLLQKLAGNEVRPLALIGFALTNRPNFRRFAKALTNRDDATPSHSNATHNSNRNTPAPMKALVAGLFGITETELDALEAGALKNRFDELKTKLAKIPTLEGEITALKNRAVEDFIAEHKAVLPAGTEDIVKDAFLKNRDGALALVNGFKAKTEAEDPLKDRKNREPAFKNREAKTPTADEKKLAAEEQQAKAIRNRAVAMKTADPKRPFSERFAAAESEIEAAQ